MFSNAEQYTSASKAFFESQLNAFNAMASIAVRGTEKIVALNIATVKESTEDSAVAVKDWLAAKDQQAFLSLVTEIAKPNPEKVAAYGRHLADIVASTQAELTKVADAQAAQVQGKLSELVDAVAKNAPAGSESAIALLKSSVAKGNEGYEKVSSAAQHAAHETEAHVAKASDKIVESVKKATDK